MKFFLLAADTQTVSLLPILLQESDSAAVVGWFASDEVGDDLAQFAPTARRFGSTEEVATAVKDDVTVVVGSGGDPLETEALLRDFARDEIPLLLQQPACSAIFAVELDMIQRDTGAPMVPVHTTYHHPVFARLAQWTQSSQTPVGKIEQVVVERALHDRSDAHVRQVLARDAMLLRRMLGKFQQVGAMSAKGSLSLANLSVQITAEHGTVARWSVLPVTQQAGAVFNLIGETGKITLAMPDQGTWTLSSTSEELPQKELEPVDQQVLGDNLRAALNGSPVSPTWEDAVRSMDVADVACESVRRGKTLTVSNERLTEEDTFKSLMAAGGCLIVLVIPFLLLLVSLIDGLEIPRQRSIELEANKGQRELTLPGDVEAVESLRLLSTNQVLPAMSRQRLFETYGRETQGAPAAYAIGRNSLTLAPVSDQNYQFELTYEGSFRIWGGWPLLLLAPIVIFLLLQLFKLAFPKGGEANSV